MKEGRVIRHGDHEYTFRPLGQNGENGVQIICRALTGNDSMGGMIVVPAPVAYKWSLMIGEE